MKLSLLFTGFAIIASLPVVSQPKFTSQTIDSNVAIGYGIALGDVDGDKKPDILLADKKQFVWYRNGDWKRFVMIDNLTESDNVCITARDLDGDGKVEVAVGAQWNPGETSDFAKSGSVHYLVRPADPTQLWKAIELHHEPTIHRMQWIKLPSAKYALLVAPLHGRGDKDGAGEGSKILLYHFPQDINSTWKTDTLEGDMHLTHNFDFIETKNETKVFIAGKEGIVLKNFLGSSIKSEKQSSLQNPTGEIRVGKLSSKSSFIAAIEPMHGTRLAVYTGNKNERIALDSNFNEGHALAVADFLYTGSDQVVAGWRNPNSDGKTGVKLYAKKDNEGKEWQSWWIDENGMACEDIRVMDLNGDGKVDIIASGRSSHNLKIYWNNSY